MHRRKAVRNAVVAALQTSPQVLALVPVPAVESSRVIPMDPDKLPRILVYLRGETAPDMLTQSPAEYRILADLIVEYVSRLRPQDGPSEDLLDDVAEALESTLDRLEMTNLGDLVREFTYQGTDVSVELRGELATCSLALKYQLELGRVVAPEVEDAFIGADIEYLVGDAPADDPTDAVDFPQ